VKAVEVKTGDRYGNLVVIRQTQNIGQLRAFVCSCDCGCELIVALKSMRSGNTLSCGCLRSRLVAQKNFKHGQSKRDRRTKEYIAWKAMHQRCRGTSGSERLYVKRGIQVCERWNEFQNFIDDMGSSPSENHSVERKNNDLGYTPGNCKWGTIEEQANNKTTSRYVFAYGEKMTVAQFSKKYNVTYDKAFRQSNRRPNEMEALIESR
jgi:hypothetical protein